MAKSKGSTARKDESKADKFFRLADQRVGMALKYINLIGNLGGPGYEKTGDTVAEIGKALQDAVNNAMERLRGKPTVSGGFRLTRSSEDQ